jgi:hypothetical protein
MCNTQEISFPKNSFTKIDPTGLRFLPPSGGTIYLVKLGSDYFRRIDVLNYTMMHDTKPRISRKADVGRYETSLRSEFPSRA